MRLKLALLLKMQEQKLNNSIQLLWLPFMLKILIVVQNKDLEVDDDNKPAPENDPLPNRNQINNQLNEGQSSGSDCVNKQAITCIIDQSAKFNGGWVMKKNPS